MTIGELIKFLEQIIKAIIEMFSKSGDAAEDAEADATV